jgi:Flp pilus assembly protein TadD
MTYWMKVGVLAVLVTGCAHSHQPYPPLAAPAGANTTAATHNQEGILHFKQGRWDLARQHFEKAMAADPKLAQAHYNLGLVLYQLGNKADGRTHFMEAANLAPGDPVIWNSPPLAPHGDVQKPLKPGEKPKEYGGDHSH